jgi:cytochrome P450
MRRTALAYVDCHQGKRIRKVVMWYVSGNRDENEIEDADRYIIDQARPRIHIALASPSTAASAMRACPS